MRLTTKGRFAVTAMVDIAIYGAEKPVTLSDISERQKISLSYLEQLFGKLRRNLLVASVRGPGGGYRMAKPLASLTVGEIIRAVDEPIDATQCRGMKNCKGDEECVTHDLWTSLNEHIFDYMDSVTLSDLVGARERKASGSSVVRLSKYKKKISGNPGGMNA
jgi:Rrf2 family iron-sulfur cluster assembly transcriptional regulator